MPVCRRGILGASVIGGKTAWFHAEGFMYMGVFDLEVAPEKQADFLRVVREQIKPYWESHGCLAYNVYQEYDADAGAGNRFIKTQLMEGMPRSIKEARAERSPEAQAIIDTFYSYAENVSFRTVMQQV
jgi:hypothetical protein